MKRVLITGAAGFVGANLVRHMLAEGHETHALERPGSDAWRLDGLAKDVAIHTTDVSVPGDARRLLSEVRPDWIFHLASHGAYPHQTNLRSIIDTNVVATSSLMEAACDVGFETFVNTGSSSEYGFKDHAPGEDEALDPNSYYAASKAFATHLARFLAHSRTVRMPTVRLYSVFGPWEQPSRLMPALLVRGLRGELPPLVDSSVARDYVYIDDVLDAYSAVARAPLADPGAVYNIGSGRQTSMGAVVAIAREVLSIQVEPVWGTMPNRAWDTSCWSANPERAGRDLGWTAHVSVADGFRRFVEWYRSSPQLQPVYDAFHTAAR